MPKVRRTRQKRDQYGRLGRLGEHGGSYSPPSDSGGLPHRVRTRGQARELLRAGKISQENFDEIAPFLPNTPG